MTLRTWLHSPPCPELPARTLQYQIPFPRETEREVEEEAMSYQQPFEHELELKEFVELIWRR